MKYKPVIQTILVVFVLLSMTTLVLADDDLPLDQQDVLYQFGENVEFSAELYDIEHIDAVWLFVQPKGLGIANFSVELNETGQIDFQLTPAQLMLKPFSDVSYWYQIDYTDGSSYVTDPQQFAYVDNRFEWEYLGSEHFDLYWQTGNQEFGVAALNIAQQSWSSLEVDFTSPQDVVQIFIYPDEGALQEAMQIGNLNWVAGHADPELNAILLSISPGPEQRVEMQRQIPHELAHLFTYASSKDGYLNQPVWLLEGLASLVEATENEDYTNQLSIAAENSDFLSIESLCTAFPTSEEEIYLAYAQSLSFVRYLKSEYGQVAITELMEKYGEGLNCAAGFSSVYDMSLSQAQTDWEKDTFGVNGTAMVWKELSPYLFLLILLAVLPLVVALTKNRIGGQDE